MNWLDKLERKFGKYAIHNLMYYIIILYILGLVIQMVNPSLYTQWLGLDAEAILHGQIWRIVTFIIQPPNASFLHCIFIIWSVRHWNICGEHSDLIFISFQEYCCMCSPAW